MDIIEPKINKSVEETRIKIIHDKITLESQFKNSVNWFYWIAGLSLVNMILVFLGNNFHFIFGLGITEFINYLFIRLANSYSFIFFLLAIGFNFFVFFIFVIVGIYGSKKNKSVLIAGIIFYGLDGLFLLVINDWLSVLFHGFALFFMIKGVTAINKIRKLEIDGPINIPEIISGSDSTSYKKTRNEMKTVVTAAVVVIFITLILAFISYQST